MSEILESSTWESTIYRIAKEDLVLGGPPIIEDGLVISGVANIASQQLTNRTNYLKNRADTNTGAITALNVLMSTANANIATAKHRLDLLEPIVATITASVVLAADDARESAQAAGVSASNAGVSAAAAAASAVVAAQHAADSVAAQAAATNAAASATAASASKDAAALSATNASGSKDAAATSATNASGSASAASGSATAANSSKTAAATSATNAGNSATAAAGSASDAATSATAAAGSATASGNSATAASISKTAAATSATNASASETNASNSATAAATSATNAGNSATAANTSKDAALGSANSASASATAAGISATSAGASAINANNSAIAAAASAAEALANALPHYKGLFTSLEALETGAIDMIAGNYADVDEGIGFDVKRYIWDNNDNKWVSSGSGDGGSGEALNAAQVKVLYESNLNTNAYIDADKAKLGGIASNATANDTDANLKARANHTGTQAISTVTGLQSAIDANAANANAAKDRANHTGTQAISTVAGLQTILDSVANIDDNTPSSAKTYSSTKIKSITDTIASNLSMGIDGVNNSISLLNTAKVDKVAGKDLSSNDYTTTEKTKLGGIAISATANDTDANLKNRANHTGTQAISTITGLQEALDNAGTGGPGGGAIIDDSNSATDKVYSSSYIETLITSISAMMAGVVSDFQNADMDLDGRKVEKVTGKGLSTEDYTTTEKAKLASISTLLTPLVATTTVTALAAAGNSIVNLSGSLGANNLVLEVDVVSTGSYTVEFYNSTNATGTLLYKAQLITGNYNDKFSYFVTAGIPALSMKITNNGTSALTATAKFTYIKLA